MNKKEVEKDMKQLAKLVYELSKKHGGIYVTATTCMGSDHSWVTYGEHLNDVDYFPKKTMHRVAKCE